MSLNINAYLSCLRMLVSVERYPESWRFPIISFKGTSCWGRKIAAFYNYLSTAFSWRTVEYSKNAVHDQQVVPLLQKSSNNDSVRRGHYRFYITYPPVISGMPLCGQLRPVQPPKWSRYYRFYMTYLPFVREMPLCEKLIRPAKPPLQTGKRDRRWL